MAKFKVGDKVGYFSGSELIGPLEVAATEEDRVWFTKGTWLPAHRLFSWGTAEPLGTSVNWDYAEAKRLQDVAKQAVKEYNDYIDRKPETIFLKMPDY